MCFSAMLFFNISKEYKLNISLCFTQLELYIITNCREKKTENITFWEKLLLLVF